MPKPNACAGLSLRLCILPSKMEQECLLPNHAVRFRMYEYDLPIPTIKTVLEEEVLEGILT